MRLKNVSTKFTETPPRRCGYTLLEILVATTILVIGLASLFGIARSAQKKSVDAADLASVQLACQSTLNELLARQAPIKSFGIRNLDDVPQWKITLDIRPSPKRGLYTLHLTAQKFTLQGDLPVGAPFHLLRWVPEERVQLPDQQNILSETMEFSDPYR